MAIARVRRFDLLGHVSTKAAVLAKLQSLGITHVEDATPLLDGVEPDARPVLEAAPDGAAMDEHLQMVERTLEFVERYAPKRTLVQQLTEPRHRVNRGQFDHTVQHFALAQVAEHAQTLEAQLSATRTQITKLEVLREDLRHWEHLDCPCGEIAPSNTVDIMLAVVDTAALPKLRAELDAATPLVHVDVLEGAGPSSYLMVFVFRGVAEEVGPLLKKFGCRTVDFSALKGTPAEARQRGAEEIVQLRDRITQLETQAADMASHRGPLLILMDHYSDRVATARVEEDMLHTRTTYYLTGWVPEREEARFTDAVHHLSPAITLELRGPTPEEEPPVLLQNGRSAPFEMIAGMYGTPAYRGTDATPWFAPWFAMFFGLCLTDAGYGFLLTAIAGWAIIMLPLYGGTRALMRILLFGGIATIVAGTLTGGWFGLTEDALPAPLRRLALINPMEDGVRVFMLCLGIGVVHIMLGLGIRLLNNVREGRIAAAVFDEGVWLAFIPCVSVLLYTGMFGGTIESASVKEAARLGAIVCTGLVILTGGREGHLALRPLMGAMKLYDVVGYFGDVLSYARLFALGLATGAIGQVTNMIAGQISDVPYGIGPVLAVAILLVGHLLNIVINALGAFIHSMRLQFIEFFGKFFLDGGTPFRPFAQAQVHTMVEGV